MNSISATNKILSASISLFFRWVHLCHFRFPWLFLGIPIRWWSSFWIPAARFQWARSFLFSVQVLWASYPSWGSTFLGLTQKTTTNKLKLPNKTPEIIDKYFRISHIFRFLCTFQLNLVIAAECTHWSLRSVSLQRVIYISISWNGIQ